MGERRGSRIDAGHLLNRSATFWISLLATCVVILLPTGLISVTMRATAWAPHPIIMWMVTGSLSLGILMLGTHWWMRQPGSTTMSFGELMLWRWVRRRKADEVLQSGSMLLGTNEARTRSEQLEMLRALNAALEVRDPYTRGHSRRVERHAYRTALAMHLPVEQIFDLRVAASLHDIGKTEVPIEVIRKQGPLDEDQWALMKKHPAAGARMIGDMGHEGLVPTVRHHHERWDGKGYPDGLSGEDIPLQARIIAVCDTFDAITSTRSYRAKSSRDKALIVLRSGAGAQFDPAVVDAFISALPRGVPGVAALSWLSFPALRKGLAQASLMFREAGAVGIAGAIATSGVAGAAATTAVNPTKYLSRPPLISVQGEDQRPERNRSRSAARKASGTGASFAAADSAASETSALRRAARPTGATAKMNAATAGRTDRSTSLEQAKAKGAGRSKTARDTEEKAHPSQKNADKVAAASKASDGSDTKVEEAIAGATETDTEVLEDQAEKNERPLVEVPSKDAGDARDGGPRRTLE